MSLLVSMVPRSTNMLEHPPTVADEQQQKEESERQDHQEHPDETPELIAASLVRFEEELGRLPPKARQWVDQALTQAPLAKNDQFRLAFLRTEVFQADRAAARFANFWETRVSLYGPHDAFQQPLTQRAVRGDDKEGATLRMGYVRTVPGQPRVLVMDPAQTVPKYNVEAVARSVRYVFEMAALQCEDVSRLGCICLVDFGTIRWFDAKLIRRLSAVVENCVPCRTSKILIINPPSRMVKYFVNLLKLCLKEKVRNRIHVVSSSEKLKRLSGVTLEEVAALKHQTWLDEMARREEIMN